MDLQALVQGQLQLASTSVPRSEPDTHLTEGHEGGSKGGGGVCGCHPPMCTSLQALALPLPCTSRARTQMVFPHTHTRAKHNTHVQHTTHNYLATHNTQHTTSNTQHTTHNTQHTTHLHGEGHVGRGTIPPLAARWPQVLKEEPAPGPAAEGYVQAVRDGGADAHVAPARDQGNPQAKHLLTSYAPYSRARTLAAQWLWHSCACCCGCLGVGSVGVW